jgi:hypothetical protein
VHRLSRQDSAFLTSISDSHEAQDALTSCLAALPFAGFAWECRAVTEQSLHAPLEMVAIDSPALANASPDASPFAAELGRAGERAVVVFDNLGRDARLVVPCKLASADCYAHLARFVRRAPPAQVRSLWQALAQTVGERLAGRTRPLWVSTAGLGVSWLHVRLDDRPQYYRHAPFRRM